MKLAADSYAFLDHSLADALVGRIDFGNVTRRLDLKLSELVGDGASDREIRQALIAHAEARDAIGALIEAARAVNPDNLMLRAVDVAALVKVRESDRLQPRQLQVNVKIRVRDVLLAAFPEPDELTTLLSQSHHRGMAAWKDSWHPSDSLLRCVRAAAKEGWLPDLLTAAARRQPENRYVQDLIDEWGARPTRTPDVARAEEVLRRGRLAGGFFLINRQPLRDSLGQMLPIAGNRVLVVRGENESGLSHSLRMLYELRDECGLQVAEVDLDQACRALGPGQTFTPFELARVIIRELDYDEQMLPRTRDDKQWSAWIVDFIKVFERRAGQDRRQVYVVLDALNRVPLNQPTADLVVALGTSIATRLPRFRLILVGFRAELPRGIRQAVLVDHTGDLTQEDVAAFFVKAHQEASVEIDTTGLLQKVVNVMLGRPCAPPGTLLDLSDRVKRELPRAVNVRG